MTNYRLVVAAVSIPTITAIFGLLWFWDRKKKKELARNDSSFLSETLNKNTNSFSGSYSSIPEPLNNGTTNSISVISGIDKIYEDEFTKQHPSLGQDWVQKVNSSFLSNESEESFTSGPSIDLSSKNYVGSTDQELSEESPSIDSEANHKATALVSSENCQTPKTELIEAQSESQIFSCPLNNEQEGKPSIDLLKDEEEEEKIDKPNDWEAEIIEDKEQEKDLIPEVKNELLVSEEVSKYEDLKSSVLTFDKNVKEELDKDNCVYLHESVNDAFGQKEVHQLSLVETSEENPEENVSKEETSEEESNDQSALPENKSNGIRNKVDLLLGTLDEYEQVDEHVEVKNGHCQDLLVNENVSECENINPMFNSLKGDNYEEDGQSDGSTPELENGTCSEVLTSDGYVSESEKTNLFIDDCDLDKMQDNSQESSLDDIKLPSKPIDVISAVFSGGQLDDSQLKEDLAYLEAQAIKMSTPNHADSEKLSHGKQLFHETRSITPPETDSDTYLSSKDLMSETMSSSQTDSSLTANQSNQSDDTEDEKENSTTSSPKRELESQLDMLSDKFFGNDQIPADKESDTLDGQHLIEDSREPDVPNSKLSQKESILGKSSSSDLPTNTDNLEQQPCTEESESKSLLPPKDAVADHSTIVEENLEKELENINKDASSQNLKDVLETELSRTIENSYSSLKTLKANEPSEEAIRTIDETSCNTPDSTHNKSNISTKEHVSQSLKSNTVTKAESDPGKAPPPKGQTKPDSVLSSNCDSKNTKFPDVHKMAVKTNSSTLYEFYFPSELCGRLIGRQGKNIFHIKERSGASVSLQPSPYTPNHQICSIEGTQEEIDEALKCISQKFPSSIYPNVDLTAITDSTQLASSPVVVPDLIQLSLPPEGVSIDVLVVSIVDGGHLFLQLPTHPTYAALERLNQFMNRCYSQPGMVPQLPRPLTVGVICAAPMMESWYRAVIVAVSEETDECEIKFVDYGGFSHVPGNMLRQIRSDFMTLPFQAIEAYLANITPLQNENYFSERTVEILQELTENGMLQAQVVSRAEDGTPYVHIYQINGNKVTFVNRELVNRGVVRWIEVL